MNYELGFNLEEALKRENLSKSDIAALRNPKISDIPITITDKQLVLFLNACGSVDEARKVLKIYYNARKSAPEMFCKRDPFSDEVQQCLKNQIYIHLPVTPNGQQIIYHRLQNGKASNYIMEPACKTYFMTVDSCLYDTGPRPGLICLFDMKHVGISHLTRIRLGAIRKFFHYVQEGLPAKLHAIHIFNVVSFFDKILSLMKPFMHADIINKMILHPSSIDYDKFSEQYNIPKSCLPSDFGGDLKSTDELHSEYITKLENKRKYFISEEIQRIDSGLIDSDSIEKEMNSLKIEEC